MFIWVFTAVLLEVCFEVGPCFVLGFFSFPVSGGPSEMSDLFEVFKVCPDHVGIREWDTSGSEEVFASNLVD